MRTDRKRRKIRYAALAFLSAALLFGCADRKDPAEIAGTEPPARETAQAEVRTPALVSESVFSLDDYSVPGLEGLYDILPAVEQEGKVLLQAGFTEAGNVRLFFTDPSGKGLSISDFDLGTGKTGTVYSERADEQAGTDPEYLVECVDPPVLHDFGTDELMLFSGDGSGFVRYPVSDRILEGIRWDGQQLLFFDVNGEKLIRTEPGNTETVLFEAGYQYQIHSLLSVTEDWAYASVFATDYYTGGTGTLLLDLSEGSAIGWSDGETYLCFCGQGYSALSRISDWDESGENTQLIFRIADTLSSEENHEVRYIREDLFPQIAPVRGGYLAENWGTGYTLYRSDATGQNVTWIELPTESYVEEAEAYFAGKTEMEPVGEEERETDGEEWEESGDIDEDWCIVATPQTDLKNATDGKYVLTRILFGEETKHLVLWDTEQGERITDPGITMNEPLFEPLKIVRTDYGEFASRVAAIRERYGVTVLLGEEADLKISTHTTSIAPIPENAEGIGLALEILESTFSEYPVGFFENLSDGGTERIVIEIVGTIRAADEDSLDFPSALTCILGNIRLLALDVSYLPEMRYTVFHEIAHMIDARLESEAIWKDDPFWSEEQWNRLNPEGFSYYNAYNDMNGEAYDLAGSDRYTGNDPDYREKKDGGEVYFIDAYSKTFPTEDRAVLMGTLLNDDSKDQLLSCPHILEKLKFYSDAIRDCFDPDGVLWPEPTRWEQRIEELETEEKQKAA